MDLERVRAVCAYYRGGIIADGRESPALLVARDWSSHVAAFAHVASMLDRLDALIDEGRREKTMRWYGFVQGALWALGSYTVDELKEHSRPDAPIPTWGES